MADKTKKVAADPKKVNKGASDDKTDKKPPVKKEENKDKDNKVNNNNDKKDDKKDNKEKKDSKSIDDKNNSKNVTPKESNNKKKVVVEEPKSEPEPEPESEPYEETPPESNHDNNNNNNNSGDDNKNWEELENAKIPIFNVGDEVVLTKDRMGIIRYKGRVNELGGGIFYGVELTDGSVGHNDGQIKGVRYFQTEEKRAMFVGHEKFRRKMNSRDHKRIDSFHAVSKNSSDGKQSPKASNHSSQDDEKEPVLSASEQERQRKQSLQQRDSIISGEGLDGAKRYENIIQYMLRQNNKYRELLLDVYVNPQTHTSIIHAFAALQEIEGDQQLQGWNELIKRWQKFL